MAVLKHIKMQNSVSNSSFYFPAASVLCQMLYRKIKSKVIRDKTLGSINISGGIFHALPAFVCALGGHTGTKCISQMTTSQTSRGM